MKTLFIYASDRLVEAQELFKVLRANGYTDFVDVGNDIKIGARIRPAYQEAYNHCQTIGVILSPGLAQQPALMDLVDQAYEDGNARKKTVFPIFFEEDTTGRFGHIKSFVGRRLFSTANTEEEQQHQIFGQLARMLRDLKGE